MGMRHWSFGVSWNFGLGYLEITLSCSIVIHYQTPKSGLLTFPMHHNRPSGTPAFITPSIIWACCKEKLALLRYRFSIVHKSHTLAKGLGSSTSITEMDVYNHFPLQNHITKSINKWYSPDHRDWFACSFIFSLKVRIFCVIFKN